MAAKNRHNHPDTLHFLARILVGTREADHARTTGGMHYDLLIQRVKDNRAAGIPPLERTT